MSNFWKKPQKCGLNGLKSVELETIWDIPQMSRILGSVSRESFEKRLEN